MVNAVNVTQFGDTGAQALTAIFKALEDMDPVRAARILGAAAVLLGLPLQFSFPAPAPKTS